MALSANTCTKSNKNKWAHDGDDSSEQFAGTANLAAALDLLESGYKDAADKMHITPNMATAVRRRNVLSVAGAPVVPLALQGRPICYTQRVQQRVTSSSVEIYINISYHCGITTKEIIDYTARILEFVESARATKQVKIYIVIASNDDAHKHELIEFVEVYDSAKNNSVARISFALCHPSMLRRLFFARLRALEAWNDRDARVLNSSKIVEYIPKGAYYIEAQMLKKYAPDYSDAIIR